MTWYREALNVNLLGSMTSLPLVIEHRLYQAPTDGLLRPPHAVGL